VLNEERLREVMAAVFQVPAASIGPESSMDSIETWDSLRHMNLVLALEEEFGVSIPDDDAANMTSWALARVVLNELLQVK
jgi:acyl carrier protein